MILGPRQPREITSKVYQMGDKSRREFLSPPPLAGRTTINDGTTIWRYEPHLRKVFTRLAPRLELEKEKFKSDLALLLENYEVNFSAGDEIADRKTYVIHLKPKSGAGNSKKIWIDKEYGLTLKTERYAPKGKLISLSYYAEINFSSPLDETLFKFKAPPHIDIIAEAPEREFKSLADIEKNIKFKFVIPTYIPEGYIFRGASLLKVKDRAILHLKYTNGMSTVSLFEWPIKRIAFPSFLGREPKVAIPTDDSLGELKLQLLKGKSKDINYILVSDISPKELKKIATSLTSP